MSSSAELVAEHQQYLDLRDQASANWRLVAELTQLVATQFMDDQPHGGDLDALRRAYLEATQKTRETVAQYRAWLIQQQGGTP